MIIEAVNSLVEYSYKQSWIMFKNNVHVITDSDSGPVSVGVVTFKEQFILFHITETVDNSVAKHVE